VILRRLIPSHSPEAHSAPDKDPVTGESLDVGISDLEEPGNAKKQNGFFNKALLKAMESEHRASGNVREVKVVGNGHSHSTCFRLVL
jgi:hypothetical protein